jgi:hypothetical protein
MAIHLIPYITTPIREFPKYWIFLMSQSDKLDIWIRRGGHLAAFLLPIKLSLSYVALIPTLLLFAYKERSNLLAIFKSIPQILIAPIVSWNLLIILTSFWGIDPATSLPQGLKFTSTIFIILLFFKISQSHNSYSLLMYLIMGQSIAALHTVIAPLLPPSMSQIFLGAVTESGQLAITSLVALGYTCAIFFNNENLKFSLGTGLLSIVNLVLFSCIGFFGSTWQLGIKIIAVTIIAAIITLSIRTARSEGSSLFAPNFRILLTLLMPLMFSALLLNLKRGPWLGVGLSILILLAYYSRRLILPAIAVICLTVASFPQIQTRLLQSSRDFFIAGGRSEMWEIGIELAAKYPLGIGYQNSPILQKYDPNIPAVHNHFHSNILNVLVETGWLGLMIFGLWIFNLVMVSQKSSLSFPNSLLIRVLSASIISWQIAGLVEYNFGDSEVFMIVLIVVATISSIVKTETERSLQTASLGQKTL